MIVAATFALFVLVGVVWYAVLIFNGLITLQNSVNKSWSDIDVLLKQRRDEVSNLVETCKGYMQHEREVFEHLAEARARAGENSGPREQAAADQLTRAATRKLLMVAENYPTLRATENFQWLQRRITELESQIADRREFYNESVREYNTRLDTLPDMLVASLLQFRPREMFKSDEAGTSLSDVPSRDAVKSNIG